MKLDIVRRDFAKIGEAWFEVEDLRGQGKTFDRKWSAFCALVPGDPNALAPLLKGQLAAHRDVDVVPSSTGVWLVAGHHWLLKAIQAIGHEIGQLHPA
ncbi:hypothetical protein [Flaviflagellibacter deserti]|uniref:Uncharacterized protein n=1 Tax=Flaviflagellibacter deserti TaxID=2267266 RepID=A0ABV9Z1V5_9HYPH